MGGATSRYKKLAIRIYKEPEVPEVNLEAKTSSPKTPLKLPMPTVAAPLPSQYCSGGIMTLNDNEFVALFRHSLYRYNAEHDQWSLFLELPPSLVKWTQTHYSLYSMVTDSDSNRLFIYINSNPCKTMILDISNGSILFESERMTLGGYHCVMQERKLVNVKGEIHLISITCDCSIEHEIWSESEEKWESLQANGTTHLRECVREYNGWLDNFNRGHVGEIRFCLVYVPSKHVILMICGTAMYGDEECGGCPIGVLEYDVATKTWAFVLEDVGIEASNAVLTADEQYVILIGPPWNYSDYLPFDTYSDPVRPRHDSGRNHICGLDIRDDSEYIPFEYPFDVGLEYNQFIAISRWKKQVVLMSGWLRNLFSSKVMDATTIWWDVVHLVNEYYCCPEIHLMQMDCGQSVTAKVPNHHMITLDPILQHSFYGEKLEWFRDPERDPIYSAGHYKDKFESTT